MNTILWILVAVTYAAMAVWIVRDYRRAFLMYNITYNGSRWVVRDERGRFVAITKSRWTLTALGGGF